MQISTVPKSTTLIFHAGDEGTSSVLLIECVPAYSSGVLEIGKRHIFASRGNRKLWSRRRSCNLQFRIQRRSCLSEEGIAKLNLSREKIGELSFIPSIAKWNFGSAERACLEGVAFLSDDNFATLTQTLTSDHRPGWLQIELAWEPKGDGIQFGWEPDGSRIEWKIDDSESASVDVVALTMGFQMFDLPWYKRHPVLWGTFVVFLLSLLISILFMGHR